MGGIEVGIEGWDIGWGFEGCDMEGCGRVGYGWGVGVWGGCVLVGGCGCRGMCVQE